MNLLDTIARIATTRPKTSLCTVGIVFIALSVLALGIRLDVDLNNMVPKGDPRFSYVFDSFKRFNSVDRAVVIIENTSPLDPATGKIPEHKTLSIRNFIDQLCDAEANTQAIDAIDNINPINQWTWENPSSHQQEQMVPVIQGYHNAAAKQSKIDTLLARSYLFLDDAGLSKVIKRFNPKYVKAKLKNGPSAAVPAEFRDRDLLGIWPEYTRFWSSQHNTDQALQMDGSYICTQDRRFHVLMLYPQHPIKNMKFCTTINERLQKLSDTISAHDDSLKIHIMGGYMSAAADFKAVRSSLFITFGSSFIGIILLFGCVYKSLRLIILIAVGLVPAIVATLGITTLLIGTKLSLIATIFAAILVGLGVDFIIHLYNAYCRGVSLNKMDRPQAARYAVCRVGPSIAVGCITSISTFAVLATSNFRGLLELGVISAIGLLVILISLMITVPAFLSLWGPQQVRQPKGLHAYGQLITNRPRLMSYIALTFIVVAITTLAISPKIFTLDDNLRNLRPYNQKSEQMRATAAELGIRFGAHRVTIYGAGTEEVLEQTLSFTSSLDHLRSSMDITLAEDLNPEIIHSHNNSVAISDISSTHPDATSTARHVLMTPWGRCHIERVNDTHITNIYPLDDANHIDRSTQRSQTLSTIPAGTVLQLMPLLGPSQLDHVAFISPLRQRHNLKRLNDEINWQEINALLTEYADKEQLYQGFFRDTRELSRRVAQQSPLLPQDLMHSSLRSTIESFFYSEKNQDRNQDSAYVMLQLNVLHDRTLIPLDEFRQAMGIALDQDGLPAQKDGFTFGTFGIPTISHYMQKTIVNDFVSLTSIAMVLVLMVLFIGIRQPLHVLLSVLTLSVGLLCTLAIMRACNTPWNVLNIAVVPLIIGIGIDNSIHFLHCLKQHSFDKQGIINTISETGHPIMMTALTSIIGFASLLLNSYRGIQGIGALAAIGIFACMISALLVLPLLIMGINKMFGKN